MPVAAVRVGIIPYTLYLWNERGKREAQARARAAAGGEPSDYPMSVWEWFHVGLEAAKGEARFNAETRVFQTNPLAWLKNGYARCDWHAADTVVRVVEEDDTEKRIGERSNVALGWVDGKGWAGGSDELALWEYVALWPRGARGRVACV